MALSARQKATLALAFDFAMGDKSVEQRVRVLFDLLLRPRAEQSTEVRAWLAAYKAAQLTLRGALDQSKLDNEAMIDQRTGDVDAILAGGDV